MYQILEPPQLQNTWWPKSNNRNHLNVDLKNMFFLFQCLNSMYMVASLLSIPLLCVSVSDIKVILQESRSQKSRRPIFSTKLQMLWLVREKKKTPSWSHVKFQFLAGASAHYETGEVKSLVAVQIMYQECQMQFPRCQRALWSRVTIAFPGQDDQSAGYTSYNFHPAKTFNKAFRKAFSWRTMMRSIVVGLVKW